MATLATKKVPKVPATFFCKTCDYTTSRKSQYDRHLTTPKHLKSTIFNDLEPFLKKSSNEYIFTNSTTIQRCHKHE